MKRKISIVGVQTTPTTDKKENLKQALALVDEAFATYKTVDMLVLPEYFYYVTPRSEADDIGAYPNEIIEAFSERAKANSSYIIAGTVANRKEDGKVYNTSVLFDRSGRVSGEYSKIHLFDALNAMGGTNESDMITAGEKLLVYDTDFGRIGVVICYDIRFPELMRTLALKGVRYLFVPAAFYSPRSDHWQDILRVTALHNSMYVTGVNLFGKLNDDNIFCGRSLISDPWGLPIAMASDKQNIIQAYVEPDYVDQIKDAIGTFHNRAPSVYDIH